MLLYQQLSRLEYGGLFDASRGVSGLMAAAYKPELAVSISSYMHDMLNDLEG
jgi:hypothetical protein